MEGPADPVGPTLGADDEDGAKEPVGERLGLDDVVGDTVPVGEVLPLGALVIIGADELKDALGAMLLEGEALMTGIGAGVTSNGNSVTSPLAAMLTNLPWSCSSWTTTKYRTSKSVVDGGPNSLLKTGQLHSSGVSGSGGWGLQLNPRQVPSTRKM